MREKLGFTLIELLVVIAVLGVLAGGIFVAINPLKRINQANDAKIKSDVGQIANASQAYFVTNQKYPTTVGDLVLSGDLKTEPKKPDGSSYTITAPDGNPCTDPCTDIIISAPLAAPQTTGGSYTWSSTTGQAGEIIPPTPTATATAGPPTATPTPIFTPSAITGLQLWLKTDTITGVSSGSPISSWADASGRGNTVTGAASYQTNAVNGLPAVRTTAGQTLRITTNFPPPYTVLYVARQNGPNRQRVLSAFNNWLLGWWGASKRQAYFDGWVTNPGGVSADSGVYLYTAVGTGSLSTVYENGAQLASNANGLSGPNGLVLGGWSGSEYSDADFAEVIIYNQALSDTDRRKVEQYLGTKYGITVQ